MPPVNALVANIHQSRKGLVDTTRRDLPRDSQVARTAQIKRGLIAINRDLRGTDPNSRP